MDVKKLLIAELLIVFLFAQCSSRSYDPSDSLTAQQKDSLLMTIVRYAVKAPENVSGDARFDKAFDEYYQQRAATCRLERYYKDGDVQYFLLSQPAPSLTEKRHATGGIIEMKNGELSRYEEVFRTWKMIPDTLKRRSYLLFDKMVNHESLESYQTKHVAPDEYIEFPDDRTSYDVNARVWKVEM